MKKIALITILLTSVFSWAITYDEAADIVLDEVLAGNTEGIKVSGLETTLGPGEIVEAWHDAVFAPYEAYYFLVDPMPTANWEHDCTWVFVSERDGEVSEYAMTTPPVDRIALRLVNVINPLTNNDTSYDEIRNEIKKRQIEIFGAESYDVDRSGMKGDRYALLISGGASMYSNYIRYWNDMAFIYRCLINYYGFEKSDIVVCMSDGDNPANDRNLWPGSGYDSSPLDLDGDGTDDYSLDATNSTVTGQLQHLVDNVASDDMVFIFTTDHGGTSGGQNTYLNLWNGETLDDDVFAGYIDNLPDDTIKVCTMEQCFSGGFIDDLNGIPNTIISTACTYSQSSWAMAPDYLFNEYVFHWTCAVNFAEPDFEGYTEDPIDADTDDDGFCQMDEAFIYAEAEDTAGETPQYYDSSSIGDTVDLFGNGNNAPSDFDLLSPPDGDTVSVTPALEWETSIDIDGDPVTYSVYYDTDDDVTDGTEVATGLTGTTYTFSSGELDYSTLYYWSIVATDGQADRWATSTWSFTTEDEVGIIEDPPIPITFALSSAKPNPSVNGARIEYAIPNSTDVTLELFDISGRKIKTLATGNRNPGYYEVTVSGLSSGVYLYRIEAGEFADTKKMVVVR